MIVDKAVEISNNHPSTPDCDIKYDCDLEC